MLPSILCAPPRDEAFARLLELNRPQRVLFPRPFRVAEGPQGCMNHHPWYSIAVHALLFIFLLGTFFGSGIEHGWAGDGRVDRWLERRSVVPRVRRSSCGVSYWRVVFFGSVSAVRLYYYYYCYCNYCFCFVLFLFFFRNFPIFFYFFIIFLFFWGVFSESTLDQLFHVETSSRR